MIRWFVATFIIYSIIFVQTRLLSNGTEPTVKERRNLINEEAISIKETVGFVVMNASTKKDASIYNKNGSIWKQISFNDGSIHPADKEFSPYAFHKDYFLLVFRCKRKTGNSYEVVVNEQTKQTKFVKISDGSYKFQTWEQHLVSICCVGFDIKTNRIKSEPNLAGKDLLYDQNEIYVPKSVKGNWLQVTWGGTKSPKTGWIQWRSKDKIIIELFYFI